MLEDYCKEAFKRGYQIGTANQDYIAVREAMIEGKELFVKAGDTQNLGAAEIDKMKAAFDKMLVVLSGKAFAYGLAFGNGEHSLLSVEERDAFVESANKFVCTPQYVLP